MAITATVLVCAAGLTYALAQLEPAAPVVEASSVVIDTVKRGELLVNVRGMGTLVPEEILFIPAIDEGRVTKRAILPGTLVTADTVLVELSNPRLEQELFDAGSQLKGGQADSSSLRVQLETERLNQEATAAQVESDYQQAKAQLEADEQLATAGLIDALTLKKSRVMAEQLAIRAKLETERLAIRSESVEAQMAAQQARVDQLRALFELKQTQLDRLKVRAGTAGVLQQLEVQVGQLVPAGTVLARVSDPGRLKAQLKIPETQAKDIQFGQRAEIDTRNGIIPGSVTRVDPAVLEGTVTVDVKLEAELPRGARPDLSVEGRIELERIDETLKVGRPVYAQAESTIGLFRLEPDGQHAVRVSVKVGRTSVNEIQIQEGLQESDRVILSDMSAWESYDRVRLN